MRTAEIRSRFLDYFAKQGHQIVESSSLVPGNDPTLLFTNAGMVQFKDVFLGKEHRPYKRAATSQKCVRAGGKHNDLENVGFTARHHTFFEMLGNFSFGDYFKKEAIHYAWDFVLNVLKLPRERLYVTVFETDDEAAEIWHKQEGVEKHRIFRMGAKDNFWSMGDTGPCGPCSELFIDRGTKYGCGKPTCNVGCDCDRFMEFWNLVFMQYDRNAAGDLTPLPKPSVDTGAGLERIASIIQEVETNYDTDIFDVIIGKTASLATKKYEPKSTLAASFRVVADHARAATFLIADGVMPSNEGRGYVLRRIMRRAIRHGKKLGFNQAFFHKTCGFVIDQMHEAYPDLRDKRAFVDRVVLSEEEQFLRTLETGLSLLEGATASMKPGQALSGDVAFKLYDTYGFPIDLTRVICEEHKFTVDEPGFEKAMDQQRSQSRKNWKGSGEHATSAIYHEIADKLRDEGVTQKFTGYEQLAGSGKVLAVIDPKDSQGILELVLDVTPFYAESGGQTGDHGTLIGKSFTGTVVDVTKPVPTMSVLKVKTMQGAVKSGDILDQKVDVRRRRLTARNHTATHLLHWALRKVLGDHVKQAGSLVNDEALRFDFAHFEAIPRDTLLKLEDLINEQIWADAGVTKKEMNKDAAVAAGAIAMFGEKYGDVVRVVSVGDVSVELCGGTHVSNAGDIHLFKIGSEQGIAAGVRRIVAYTSEGAFNYLREREAESRYVREKFKAASLEEIEQKLDKVAATEKDLRKQIERMSAAAAGNEVDDMLKTAITFGSTAVIAWECAADEQGVKRLREIADQIRMKATNSVLVVGMKGKDDGKVHLLAAVGKDAPKSVSAAEIIKGLSPMIDGRGGGKPDMAQAGGTKPEGLAAALAAAPKLVSQQIGQN